MVSTLYHIRTSRYGGMGTKCAEGGAVRRHGWPGTHLGADTFQSVFTTWSLSLVPRPCHATATTYIDDVSNYLAIARLQTSRKTNSISTATKKGGCYKFDVSVCLLVASPKRTCIHIILLWRPTSLAFIRILLSKRRQKGGRARCWYENSPFRFPSARLQRRTRSYTLIEPSPKDRIRCGHLQYIMVLTCVTSYLFISLFNI